MQVVYICAALYKISTGIPVSRGPSETAGLLVCLTCLLFQLVPVQPRDTKENLQQIKAAEYNIFIDVYNAVTIKPKCHS